MITLDTSLARVQRRLDDEKEEIWAKAQLKDWLQEGYDNLCRDGECLFDMAMYGAQPMVGNYTKEFERQFMKGMVIFKRFTCTRPYDAEHMDGDAITSNHTRPSEETNMTEEGHTPTPNYLIDLPWNYVSIDRVTHNWLRLSPEQDRYHRKVRYAYQTLQGQVFSYQMDQDGWQKMRLINVPVAASDTQTYSGVYGVIRQLDAAELTDEPVNGSYGIHRSVPKHFAGRQYGAIRRLIGDDYATRVEYYRMGEKLDKRPFELPDRAVKYVEWWAMYRAYSQPGEGENLKLAQHCRDRYQRGLELIKRRIETTMRERTIAMGQKRQTGRDGYLQHFPADYGYSRPFRAP